MAPARNGAWPYWVTPNLAVGYAPFKPEDLTLLRSLGISAILNLCGEMAELCRLEEAQGFEVYHLPLDDEAAPDPEVLENALEWLDEALYLGKKTFIHCRFGIGRTGTLLYAYMLRRGLPPRKAEKILKNLRAKPDNYYQWRAVRRYAKLNPPLNILTPNLEHATRLDLSHFHQAYENLCAKYGDPALRPEAPAPCPALRRDLYLVEASFLQARLDSGMDSQARQALRERAAKPRQTCPLLEQGKCLLYFSRPLQCRLDRLDPLARVELWQTELAPALEHLSRDLHAVYFELPAASDCPRYSLADTVSERFVQDFFHHLASLLKS